jgi:hypothetical protein
VLQVRWWDAETSTLGNFFEILAPREWTVEQLRERLQALLLPGLDPTAPPALGLAKVLLFGATPLTPAAVLALKWDDPKLFGNTRTIGDPPLSLRNGSLLVARDNSKVKTTVASASTSASAAIGKGKVGSSLAWYRQAALTAARGGSADVVLATGTPSGVKTPRVHAEPVLRIHVYQPAAVAPELPTDGGEGLFTEESKDDSELADN